MRLQEKAYRGRELDSLARKYTREIVRLLTQPENERALKQGKTLSGYIDLKPLGLDRPNLIGIELEIDSNLDVDMIGGSGGFQIIPGKPEISYISVTISMPKPYTRQHLDRLQDELVEIMRHEIEHSTQDPERIDQIANFSDDPFGSKQNMLDYFTTPEEQAGHVTGWMKLAKKKRRPIKDVIKQQVRYIKQQAEREGMPASDARFASDEILKKFIAYALERYPNMR